MGSGAKRNARGEKLDLAGCLAGCFAEYSAQCRAECIAKYLRGCLADVLPNIFSTNIQETQTFVTSRVQESRFRSWSILPRASILPRSLPARSLRLKTMKMEGGLYTRGRTRTNLTGWCCGRSVCSKIRGCCPNLSARAAVHSRLHFLCTISAARVRERTSVYSPAWISNVHTIQELAIVLSLVNPSNISQSIGNLNVFEKKSRKIEPALPSCTDGKGQRAHLHDE